MEVLEAKKLHKEMKAFCTYKLRTFLGSDDVADLTRQVLSVPQGDTKEIIRALLSPGPGQDAPINSFANELLSMKRKYEALMEKDRARIRVLEAVPLQEGVTAYQKKQPDELAPGLKKKKSSKQAKKQRQQRQAESRETTKFVRKYCDCQALVHPLVNNCLKCGKIICSREGEGPCMFCGAAEAAAAARNGAAIEKANAHRDKLIGYDNDARVTRVYDDQADHFDYHGNQWLSEEERQLFQKRQEENAARIKESERKIVITLDIAGRQIVQHEGVADQAYTAVPEPEVRYANQAPEGYEGPVVTSRGGVVLPEAEMDEEAVLDPFLIAATERRPGAFTNPFLQTARPAFRTSNAKRPKDFLASEGVKGGPVPRKILT